MMEFLVMPEHLIGGARRGCGPGIAPPSHGPEPEPLSLPVSRYFIDGREKDETQRVQASTVAPCEIVSSSSRQITTNRRASRT